MDASGPSHDGTKPPATRPSAGHSSEESVVLPTIEDVARIALGLSSTAQSTDAFLNEVPLVGGDDALRQQARDLDRYLLRSSSGFRFRANLSQHEELYAGVGRQLAVLEARRAYERVDAYRGFLDQRVNWDEVARFCDLPETSKDNYIKRYVASDKLALYVDREIPGGSCWDTSTGTSGTPTSWYRGPAEVEEAHRKLKFLAEIIVGQGTYSMINGFALGSWATGMTVARGVGRDPKSIVYNVGPNPEMILQQIQESWTIAPQRPVVVAGYPPHIEEVVRLAAKAGIPLHEHSVIAVVGGEPMSESQRARMVKPIGDNGNLKTGFCNVLSFYGASDIDINIAFETPFESWLRNQLIANHDLARSFLGDRSSFVPMIFNYDPLAHLIEVNGEGRLIYTEVSGNRISPRIRYNLGDAGTIRPLSQVMNLLDDHGIKLPFQPMSHHPLLFVWGRVDDGITYRGANLAWENLQEGIRRAGLGEQVKYFGLAQFEQHDQLRTVFMIHVADDQDCAAVLTNGRQILRDIIGHICAINHDFKEQIEHVSGPSDLPLLSVYHNDSPMTEHARLNPSRKQKHVYLGSDAERAREIESGGVIFELNS